MGDQPDYGVLEEALKKHHPNDLESGIDHASQAIKKYTGDARLYLLRAKLSYKFLLIRYQHKGNGHIRNCLGDCDQAIAIIERGVEWGGITTVKRHALQLGYLCCRRLKDIQKEKEFKHRMSEMDIKYPIAERTLSQLLFMSPDQLRQNCTYNLKEMLFPKASYIDPPLLDDVIWCYKERQTVCRNCFYNDLKLSRGYDAKGKCTQCQWEFKKLLVIPKSQMTVNHYKSEIIAIPPWPKSKPNELPFESCAKPTDKSKDHKRCLIMSRNSAVWYAHTVEELVIWTVEREYGCTFEDFIRTVFQPVTISPYYLPQLYNPVDAQMAATMYSAALMPFCQTHPYPPMASISYTNFFILQTATPMPYYGEVIGPPASYIQPQLATIQILLAPPQSPSDKMGKIFETLTCSN